MTDFEKLQKLPALDKGKTYTKKRLDIKSVTTYIPLETSKNLLLDRDAHIDFVSTDLFIITNKMRGDIFLINKIGKLILHFNQKGGLGYKRISFLAYDEKGKELFILDKTTKRISVFTEKGKLLRNMSLPSDYNFVEIYNFNDSLLLAYHMHNEGSILQHKPYMFLSKKDGGIVSKLNLSLGNANPSSLKTVVGPHTSTSFIMGHVGIPDNCKFGNQFILANNSMDVIYLLKQDFSLIPLFTQHPSVFDEHPTAVSVGLITDRYLVVCVYSIDIKLAKEYREKGKKWKPPYGYYVFDRKTGQFFEDEENGEYRVFKTDIPKDLTVELLDTFYLKELLKKGKLKGDLKKTVENLKMDDNPVIKIRKIIYNGK